MREQDQRKINKEAQNELRKQVARLKECGRSTVEVSKITGFARQTVNRIWKMFQGGGLEAIKVKPRGRRAGEKRRLNPKQEKDFQRLMADKTPEQLRFKFALWTREAVREVALKLFGIELPLRTVGHYLKRWGFTARKPTVRAYERNPKAVAEWLEKSYPAIKERAKTEGGEIHWGDETGIEASDYARSGYAPKGRTPVLISAGNSKRTRINMISAITNQGKVRFMMYEDSMTVEIFIKFMERLIRDSEKKIFLIVDNLKVHHGRQTKEWLDKRGERIEVFYLPSYAPDLNPDERLNSDLKGQFRSGPSAFTRDEVKSKVRSGLKIIQSDPERVRKYFQDPNIAYAA